MAKQKTMNTQNEIKLWRHGENVFEKLDKLPKGLKETKTDTIATGSHNNPHTFKGGKIYLKQESDVVFGYLKAKDTILYHCEHSPKGVLLKDGFYRLRKAIEYTPEGFKQVID